MRRKEKKKDNRGLSLVELIIVIAIMVILVGVTSYGMSLISNKPVDECAKKIEMVLNRNRTSSMGKQEAWVKFLLDGNGHVTVQEYKETAKEKQERETDPSLAPPVQQYVIGADGINIRLSYRGGTSIILSSTPRRVKFSRDSGALVGDPDDADNGNKVCIKIEVFRGDYGSATYIRTIDLDELTGKITLQ